MVYRADAFERDEQETREFKMRNQDHAYIKACRAVHPDMETVDFKLPEVKEDAKPTVIQDSTPTELTISVRGASGRTITFVQKVSDAKKFNMTEATPENLCSGGKAVSMTDLCKVVARKHNISVRDITGVGRHHNVVAARSEVAWYARTYMKRSWTQIGQYLNRDHTTAMNLVARYERKNGGTNDSAA